MKSKLVTRFWSVLSMVAMLVTIAPAQERATAATVLVRMTVTANVADGKRVPEIKREDVFIQQGKERLKVTDWIPAQGEHGGLELFILIDDASDSSLGSQLADLRSFINTQPPTTLVGVGYMRNATVQIAQNLTRDHAAAAKALRLPLGSVGAYGSPYLSVMDLMKRWPSTNNRREVLMVTDGIDRARRGPWWRGLSVNPDMDSASAVAMRTSTIIHTIYTPGVGRLRRNYWEVSSGQMNMAALSDVTGGESFFLGLQSPVSFAPYLDQLQKILSNQYLLSFSAKAGPKARLQYINLSTEIAGVEFAAANAVWVPAAK